ncbi:MAG: Succinate dehydrogenase iron-sulfur protein, partial [uncultured Friedmanniella sp.]
GRPVGLRPDHPGRRLHLRPDRDGAGRARRTHPQGELRPRLRRRHLHRLRRLRGGLPQRVGDAVHRRQGDPPRAAAARPAGTALPGARHGRPARRGGLRRLHQHRRVHRGLPQGDPLRDDLPAQPGPVRRAHPPQQL